MFASLWIVSTIVAAGAQSLRNALQRGLTVTLGTLGATLIALSGDASDWLGFGAFERVARLSIIVVTAGGVYFATLWLTGFRLRDFRRRGAE